jgi:hypothetical protein
VRRTVNSFAAVYPFSRAAVRLGRRFDARCALHNEANSLSGNRFDSGASENADNSRLHVADSARFAGIVVYFAGRRYGVK